MGKLAKVETLETCEREIAEGFRQSCRALARIRDKRLYLEAGYSNFESYCQERLGIGRHRGIQLANAEQIIKSLPAKCRPLVNNERQVREVSAVPEERRGAVMRRARASGKVTAKSIEIAALEDAIESGDLMVVAPAPMLEAMVGGNVVEESKTVIFEPAELDRLVGINEIPAVSNECLGCQARDNEIRKLFERIESLEAEVAAANEGEIPIDEPVSRVELIPYPGGPGVDMSALWRFPVARVLEEKLTVRRKQTDCHITEIAIFDPKMIDNIQAILKNRVTRTDGNYG